jgi:hypothetical protein
MPHERTLEAARHAEATAVLNVRIDEALHSLTDLFAQRSKALQSLASTGVVDPAFMNRLQSTESVTAAACRVNLHKFMALETVAPQSQQPLAGADSVLGMAKTRIIRVRPSPSPPRIGLRRSKSAKRRPAESRLRAARRLKGIFSKRQLPARASSTDALDGCPSGLSQLAREKALVAGRSGSTGAYLD